jgi:hypothetical protein
MTDCRVICGHILDEKRAAYPHPELGYRIVEI